MHKHIYNNMYGAGIVVMLLAAVLFFFACSGNDAEARASEKNDDSLLVKVAVFPTLDAMPITLAKEWEVLDSLGVNVEVDVYRSQMDAEKALVEGRADAVLTDMIRVGWWQWQKKPIRFAFATYRPLFIVPNRTLRVSKVEQLDDRMIAATRNSIEDFFIDKVIAGIKNRKGQILRPQINSVELRLGMLKAGQLDAAVLNALQALKARNAKFHSLKLQSDTLNSLAGFAFNTNALATKGEQLATLRNAYDIVVARLHKSASMPHHGEQTRKALFIGSEIDTLIKPCADFAITTAPADKCKGEVAEWLSHHAGIVGYNCDTLFVK